MLNSVCRSYDVQRHDEGEGKMAKIIFENPNTEDDAVRHLPKILAELILLKLKAKREAECLEVGQA